MEPGAPAQQHAAREAGHDAREGDTVGASYKRTKTTGRLLLQSVKLIQKKPKEVPSVLIPETMDEGDGALSSPALKR